MGNYTYKRNPQAGSSVTSNMGGGRTVTLQPNETFRTENSCEMLDFLAGLPSDANYDETNPGAIANLRSEAEAAGCLASGDSPPANPQPGAGTPVPAAPPPPEGDSAANQGAPSPSVGGSVQGPPPEAEPPPEPAAGRPNTTHGGERSHAPASEADPVALFSGAFTLEETDLKVATPLLPMVLIRRHRSGAPHYGPLGWNWDHNHNVYLRELDTGSVARWTGRLAEDLFVANGAGFDPPRGVFETLERLPVLDTEYRIGAAEGLSWHFARPPGWTDVERIPLAEISDRHGNRLTYSYDGRNRLAEVSDDQGRFLRFGYGECDLLEWIEDAAGRRVVYYHHPDIEHLVEVRWPATPDQPEGPRRGYAYGPQSAHPWLRHSVVRVEDHDGNTVVQSEYEEDPASHAFARVTAQLIGDWLWQYAYSQLQYVPPSPLHLNLPAERTEVMEPDFGVTTYTFNYRGDLLDLRRRLVRDGSFRVVAWTHEYDEQGNRVRVTAPDGGEELATYDTANPDPRMRGRLLRRELTARAGFPSPSRIVWRGEYEPAFQLLRRERDEAGEVTEYRYDFDVAPGPAATGRLVEMRHPQALLPDGTVQTATTHFEANARGQVTAMTSPAGIRTEVEHEAVGPLDGFVRLRRYDAGGLGLEWRYGYDALGRVETIIAPSGGERVLLHDPLDRVVELRAPDIGGERGVVRVHYDGSGAAVALARPVGEFSEPGFADPAIEDRFERDLFGALTRAAYAANCASPCTVAICRDHRGNPLRVVDPEGLETYLRYDERGLLLSQEARDPDGGVLALARRFYDIAGRVMRETAAPDETLVTEHQYDAFGRPLRVTMPNGSVRRLVWGDCDRLEEESVEGDDGSGTVRLLSRIRYGYDARGRMSRRIESRFEDDPGTAVDLETRFFHDADARLERIVDPRGGEGKFAYDGIGRLILSISPSGEELQIARDDANGVELRTRRFSEHGATVDRTGTWRTDVRGRLVSQADANGIERQIRWDDRDLPVAETEPDGVERTRRFGALGELVETVVDPEGLAIASRWSFDARRAPIRFEDPDGAVTIYGYDRLGRPASATYPDGATRKVEYGANGKLANESLADGTVLNHVYDAAGRVIELGAGGSGGGLAPHLYGYDGLDRLVRAEAGAMLVERRFDSIGRLVGETSDGAVLSLAYDDLNGTAERVWPDGRRERIESDADGRPVRVERVAAGALGSGAALIAQLVPRDGQTLSSATLLGSVDETIDYDLSDRPVKMLFQSGGGIEIDGRIASYDARHRRQAGVRLGPQALARHHSYDRNDRLIQTAEGFAPPAVPDLATQAAQDGFNAATNAAAAGAPRILGFSHSAADERLAMTETGQPPIAYAYDPAHALENQDGVPVSHDNNGVRQLDGARQYDADALGRIVRVQNGGGGVLAEIGYDALGRIASLSESGGAATRFHRFGNELWLERQAGADLRQHTPMPFGRGTLALHEAARTLLCLHDLRGSLSALCDDAGQALEYFRYDPFGMPAVLAPDGTPLAGPSEGQPPLFGGMRWLGAAQLYLAGPRLQDPTSGLFLSRDPRGYAAGPNPYVYAGQDPINLIDPDGEFPFLALFVVMGIGALLGGGLNAARQGIQIAEGSRGEFSWGELGLSMGIGAVAAPILVAVPELAVPLAAWGVAGGISEFSQGNTATGLFDIVTSLAPFGFKGPRNATFGRGSLIGEARGLGPGATRAERLGRFNEIDANSRKLASNIWNRRFYRGTTYYEAVQAEQENMLDLGTVFGRQRQAQAPPRLGVGLYFTDTLEPPAAGSAPYWADVHGGRGRGGGPAVLEAELPHWRWWQIQREPGVVSGVEQPTYTGPATLETYVPEGVAPRFNDAANWRNLPWPIEPRGAPVFTPLWPLLFTPPYRAPDAASAAPSGSGNNGAGAGAAK